MHVEDVNEHGPELEGADDLWVPRDPPRDVVIARVRVVDRDAPQNGPPFRVRVCENRNIEGCRDLKLTVTQRKFTCAVWSRLRVLGLHRKRLPNKKRHTLSCRV